MRVEHFEYFITVANEGSFSKAAKRLYLSEPTLNKNISAFESELGFKLFMRSKRQLTLTTEGSAFLPFAKQITEMIDSSVESVRKLCEVSNSSLKINHIAVDSDPVLDNVIAVLAKNDSIKTISINEDNPRDYVNRLLGESPSVDVDITILTSTENLPLSIESRVIRRLHEAIVVPEGHPLSKRDELQLSDLRNRTLVFSSALPNEAHARLIRKIDSDSTLSISHVFVNSIGSALKLVEIDQGLLVKTNMYELPEGFVSIPLETDFALTLTALWNKNNTSEALQLFVKALDDQLERHRP